MVVVDAKRGEPRRTIMNRPISYRELSGMVGRVRPISAAKSYAGLMLRPLASIRLKRWARRGDRPSEASRFAERRHQAMCDHLVARVSQAGITLTHHLPVDLDTDNLEAVRRAISPSTV